MKTKFINLLYLILALSITSCSLDDVDMNNQGDILEEFLVQDEGSAKAVLNGMYLSFRNDDMVRFSAALMVSGNEQVTVGNVLDVNRFRENNVDAGIVTVSDGAFQKLSYTINAGNYLISQIEAGKAGDKIKDETKNQILGEAKTLRAFARFMLLRSFGQFYDINSEYGIVISNKPLTSKDQLPRNTVKESYDAIIKDLTFAVKNNADTKTHVYATKTTAQALLAKVYLYKKEYKKAQILAKEVIKSNTGGYSLESKYSDIYDKRWTSSEVLFSTFTNDKNEFFLGTGEYGDQIIQPSSFFKKLAQNNLKFDPINFMFGYDPRFVYSYNRPENKPNKQNFKYFFENDGNTIYYMRLAEVYLIYAEAYTRNSENTTYVEAIKAVNDIRNRAGAISKLPTNLTKTELIKKIREEKMLELFLETGETWFDIVRHIDLGDLGFSIKPTLIKKEQLIFPIPIRAIEGNRNLVQNPGY